MKRDLALVILGIIIGSITMNIYLSSRIDGLYISREKLKIELYETVERLKKVEAQWQSHRTALVKEVDIQFAKPLADPFIEVALRQQILSLTEDLVGEELEKLSPSLVLQLLHQRIIEADGRRFRLHVETVIISEKLTYVLRCAPLTELSEDEP